VKNKTFILLIIIFCGVIVASLMLRQRPAVTIAKIGNPAPDVELIDINKNKVRLSELNGSVVFVNFWATWCESCVEELPSMERLLRNLADNPKFRPVTILYRDNIENASSFMKLNGYTFPVYSNPDESAPRKFGITGVPETFIVDKKGILRDKVIGPADWDSPVVFSTLQSLLNEP